jgi:hypothetical protein
MIELKMSATVALVFRMLCVDLIPNTYSRTGSRYLLVAFGGERFFCFENLIGRGTILPPQRGFISY